MSAVRAVTSLAAAAAAAAVGLLWGLATPAQAAAAATTADPPYSLRQLGAQLAALGAPDDVYDHFAHQYGSYHPNGQPRNVSCPVACHILRYAFGQTAGRGNPSYKNDTQYWSVQQQDTSPQCVFLPTSANDVAGAVLVAEFSNCPFAAKSGGHACFSGASSIEDGVTIDFQLLNEITVSSDRTTTSVGPGNRWIDVYSSLSPRNLSVIGGRVSGIGVGGLTLGGGISFFSNRYGWACDNVRNYQLVLAGGRILEVNYSSYPDLYYALRGGGNNFGLVTRFDLVTFEQGLMWGGMVVYPIAANASIFAALAGFAHASPPDPDAAVLCSFAYAEGQYFAANSYEYAQPVANPPIFHPFTSIPGNFSDTTRITTLPNITNEFEAVNPAGLRETYTTATFTMSAALARHILTIFTQQVDPIKDSIPGLLPAITFQPISLSEIAHFAQNGGNALGLAGTREPLLLVNLAVMWSDAADDAAVFQATNAVIAQARAAALKMGGLRRRYVYQNYASQKQDVIGSYGAPSRRRLVAASRQYDPRAVFQKLQPGYFKLGIV